MSHHYDILYIQQYLDGKLSPEQMHDLERAALDDELLQDAIDGYRSTSSVDHRQLSLLQKRFAARIETHLENKNTNYFTWQRLTIASLAGLLFIVIAVLFWMMQNPDRSTQANSQASVLSIQEKVTVRAIDGDLVPKIGWTELRDQASISNIPAAVGEKVIVQFELTEDHKPINVHFVSEHAESVTGAITKMLDEGTTWEGSSGTIELQF